MALGAAEVDILAMVLRWGLPIGIGGIAASLSGSLYVTRFISSWLYGIPYDRQRHTRHCFRAVTVGDWTCLLSPRSARDRSRPDDCLTARLNPDAAVDRHPVLVLLYAHADRRTLLVQIGNRTESVRLVLFE